MTGYLIDGNEPLVVYQTVKRAADERARDWERA